MHKSLFLEENELKSDSVFNDNIDGKLIKNMIHEAQEFYILPLLGSRLYNELTEQIYTAIITSGATAITQTNYALLVDYIQPCLKKYVRSDAYIFLNYRLTNKAVSTSSSQYSQAIDLSTAKSLSAMEKERAETLGQRLVAFLKARYADYPLYLNSNVSNGELTSAKNAYFCGIYFPHHSKYNSLNGYTNESDNCN